MFDISFDIVNDVPALATRWRALEAAAQGGFFRSWSYLHTLLPHLPAPRLLAVRQDGQDVALGLFNETRTWRGTRLSLHEAGRQPFDGLYVEHNGLLLRPGAEACLVPALTEAARHGTVHLSGIDALHLQAARRAGAAALQKTSPAPAIDLAALRPGGQPYLDTLGANTRAQIRRSRRQYGAELAITPAESVTEALIFLDRLMTLHQARWITRGQPGAFAWPAIRTFHARLVSAALPRGEVALLRVTAGAREIGYLYQFQHGGTVANYQAGLAGEVDARLKPGLVCHALAIEHAARSGAAVYDFLAGAQRYKASLIPSDAAAGQDLHWVTLRPRAWRLGKNWGECAIPPRPPVET